jgi:outer membrane protein OmpA-like peptidoglycan-associated protein
MRTYLSQSLFVCMFVWLSQITVPRLPVSMVVPSAFSALKKDGSQLHFPAILFLKNSEQMDETSKDSLNSIMEILLDNPNVVISLSGHCSSDEKNPDDLSFNRALNIRNYLIQKGFDSDRLVTRGLGTSNPFNSDSHINTVANVRQKEYLIGQNRRVVAAVIGTDDGRRK